MNKLFGSGSVRRAFIKAELDIKDRPLLPLLGGAVGAVFLAVATALLSRHTVNYVTLLTPGRPPPIPPAPGIDWPLVLGLAAAGAVIGILVVWFGLGVLHLVKYHRSGGEDENWEQPSCIASGNAISFLLRLRDDTEPSPSKVTECHARLSTSDVPLIVSRGSAEFIDRGSEVQAMFIGAAYGEYAVTWYGTNRSRKHEISRAVHDAQLRAAP